MLRCSGLGKLGRLALGKRQLVALGGLLVLVAWVVAGLTIYRARETALRHARIEADNLAAAFANDDAHIMARMVGSMDALAQQLRAAKPPRDYYAYARQAQLLEPQAVHVGIIGPDGRLLASSVGPHVKQVDLSDREHFRIHLDGGFKGVFIGKPVKGRVSGNVAIQLTRRVEDRDGKFLAVIDYSLPPASFTALQKLVDLGAHGTIVLTGLDNVILARFTRQNPDGVFAVGRSVAGGGRPSEFLPDGHGSYVKEGAIDHVERVLAWRRVGDFPLVVTVGVPVAKVLAPVRRDALLVGGFTAVASILLLVFGDRLLSKQRKLREANARLAADNAARRAAEQRLRESEIRFRQYAEAASDWFWETGVNGEFTFVSERFAEVAGVPVTEVIGKTPKQLRHEPGDPALWPAHRKAIANRCAWRDFPYLAHRPDGGVRHTRVSGVPVFGEDGAFAGYRGVGRDVTAEIEASRATRQQETRLREALEALHDGIALYDAEERLVMCNSRYLEMYPWQAGFLKAGRRFEDLLRRTAENRAYVAAELGQDAWVADRLAKFRNGAGFAFEEQYSDGKWLRQANYPTGTGGTISLRIDVTDIKEAEQRMRDAIESIPGNFVLYDRHDRVILCNRNFSRFFHRGEAAADLTGRGFDELFHSMLARGFFQLNGKDPETWLAGRKNVHRTGSSEPLSVRLNDGRWLDVHERRTAEGGCVSIAVDVSARRRIELALQENEATLRSLLAASPDALLVLDSGGRVTMASAKAEALFGYSQAELLGMPLTNVIPDSPLNAAMAEYFLEPYSAIAERKDGSAFPVEIAINPCETAAGTVALAAVRDMSTRIEIDEATRQAQKLEALGTLAGGIAHDLNNTLVPIMGMTQIVLESTEPTTIEYELLGDVLLSAGRAKALVRQILDFSRSESSGRQYLDLRAATADAVRLVRAAVPPLIDLRTELPHTAVSVFGNETQMHQVLLNLCTNSAQAIGARAGEIRVALDVAGLDRRRARALLLQPGRYALLTVTDDGRGMSEAVRRRIFEPFFTTKGVGEGTGLGMSIVHGIVSGCDGIVKVWSRLGEGTRVEIYLPLIDMPGETGGQDMKAPALAYK